MDNRVSGNVSFGFADVSWADEFDRLPDSLKRAVERRAGQFETADDLRRFVEQMRRRG